MYFYTTHILNLRIESENRKRREVVTLDNVQMKSTCILLYNSPTKFENWIGEQKKEKRVATLNKLST